MGKVVYSGAASLDFLVRLMTRHPMPNAKVAVPNIEGLDILIDMGLQPSQVVVWSEFIAVSDSEWQGVFEVNDL